MIQLKQLFAFALAVAMLQAASSRTEAALMVYEGFEGYNTAAQIKGQFPNANSIGLDQNSAWISSSATQQTMIESGLSFGSGLSQLAVHGGAVQRQNSVSSSVSAKFNIAPSNFTNGQFVGTMYSSYLVQTSGPSLNDNAHVVVFGGGNSNTRRFRSAATTDAGNVLGADYVGTTLTAGMGNINGGDTYMILSRFTRVGQAISAMDPGVATVWALTSDQFAYFKTNDWADIDAATVGAGSSNVWGKAVNTHSTAILPADTAKNFLDNSLYWTIGSGSTTAGANVKFDELRMGASFDDVTPVVPEPTSIALVMLGLVGAGFARRAMKK